ncbi:MAG: PKD domain-containing protein [Zestosphaera sp.]
MVTVWDLISWGLWVGLYGGVACIIVAVASKTLGREYAGTLFLSGLAALAVAGFGWTLVIAAAPASSGTWGWIYLAMAGGLLAISGIYFAIGRVEEGGKHLLYAFLVVGLMAFTAALAGGGAVSAGALTVRVSADRTTVNAGESVSLTISAADATLPITITVDWGDGNRVSEAIYAKEKTYSHTYSVGSEAAKAYTITVNASDARGRAGFNTLSVIVQNTDWCPYPWYLSFMCPLVQGVRVVLPGLDLVKLVTSPEFPTSDGDPVYEVYKVVLATSLAALGLYLALGLAFGVFEGRVIEVFKDSVLALILALLIPWVYNASVGMMDYVALTVTPWVDPLLPAMTIIAVGVATGYFVPALANVASTLLIVLILLSAVVIMRYVLILAIIAAFPLIAIASVNPLFRGIMRYALTLLAGLVIAGPLTAVFLKILTTVAPGGGVTMSFIYPIVGGVLPNVLGVFGAGVLPSLGGVVVERVKGVVGRAASTAPTTLARAGQAVRVPAPALTASATQVRTAPIITPTTVKASLREARLAAGVSEGVAVATPGLTAFMESAEAERRAVESAAEGLGLDAGLAKALPPQHAEALREAVELGAQKAVQRAMRESYTQALQEAEPASPKAKALETFTKTLASQSWRQLRANARAFAREFGHSIAQELGARVVRDDVHAGGIRVRGDAYEEERARSRRAVHV